MKKDIYNNIYRISDTKHLSLKYLSILNKINYETLRTKAKRNSDLSDDLIELMVKTYNLTLKQLEELKDEENYHKMIDHKFYWNIIHNVNENNISKELGLKQISAILINADGNYSYLNKDIKFIPSYDLNNYLKYTTSLILINNNKKYRRNNIDPVSSAIEEEIEIINYCINKINNGYSKDILKDIFFKKYILGYSTNEILNILNLNKNRFYRLLNETNNVAYKIFGLYTKHEIEKSISCISNI